MIPEAMFLFLLIGDGKTAYEEKYIGKLVDVKVVKINRNTLFGKIDNTKDMRAA